MSGGRITLFELLGFKVNVDATWIFLAVFVTWSLATGYFPFEFQGYPQATYWAMGVFGALGLFASIILHELSHSLVARRYGLPIRGITLFIFGGVAEMEREPPSAKSEFLMAIAGPLASLVLAAAFYQAAIAGERVGAPEPLTGVLAYLALLNLVLAIFNMIPAFPLDGGRALRAALWHWSGDMRRATRRAAAIGSGFGLVLIVAGVATLVSGNFVAGLWWSLIGLFLNNPARASVAEVDLRTAFSGEPVSRFMTGDVVAVSPDLGLRDFVEDYVYRYHFDMFPVVRDGVLIGCITTKQIRQVPRERWDEVRVGDVMAPTSPDNTIDRRADALEALALMQRTGNSRLLVVDGDRLVGIVAMKDMLQLLALKMDLEGHP